MQCTLRGLTIDKHESYDCSSAMPTIYAVQGMHELVRTVLRAKTGPVF